MNKKIKLKESLEKDLEEIEAQIKELIPIRKYKRRELKTLFIIRRQTKSTIKKLS